MNKKTDPEDFYTIRPAWPDDLAQLESIEVEALQKYAEVGMKLIAAREPLAPAMLDHAQIEGRLFVVATLADAPAGFALLRKIQTQAFIEECAIHPDHGRQGLGQKLIETCCQWARDNGCGAIWASTFEDIPWNRPFYERVGFTVVPEDDLPAALTPIRHEEARKALSRKTRVFVMRKLD